MRASPCAVALGTPHQGAGGDDDIPDEFSAFGPGGGGGAGEPEKGPLWTAAESLHERAAKAVAAVTLAEDADPSTKAAEQAHLATFAEDEQAAPGGGGEEEESPAKKEQTVDDAVGSDESAAMLNQR